MSLVPDYDENSSTSDSESDSGAPEQPRQPSSKLPRPQFLQNPEDQSATPPDDLPKTTSVFTNPYIQAENEKTAILEKHVKMISSQDTDVRTINGKKICWNYRKGRCRFGHNCIYAHDSDLQKTKEQLLEMESQVQQQNGVFCQSQLLQQPTVIKSGEICKPVDRKRRRPGLSQGLVPGKKVMKDFMKHKK